MSEPVKRNIFGEEVRYADTDIGNVIQQFISPGFYSAKSDDNLTNELYRLYTVVGKDFLPRARVKNLTYDKTTYTLSPQERSDFQQIMGEYTRKELEALINSFKYEVADDETKAEMIKKVNDEGREIAKEEFLIKKGLK